MFTLRFSGYLILIFLFSIQKGQCRKCRRCSTVTLESTGDLYRAPVEGAAKVRDMTLIEETSSGGRGTCVLGITYGFFGPEAYVDMGCAGEFEICFVEGRAEEMTCANDGSEMMTLCEFDTSCDVHSIVLLESISSEPCIEDFSFTASNNGISVTKGCAAKFAVGCRDCMD